MGSLASGFGSRRQPSARAVSQSAWPSARDASPRSSLSHGAKLRLGAPWRGVARGHRSHPWIFAFHLAQQIRRWRETVGERKEATRWCLAVLPRLLALLASLRRHHPLLDTAGALNPDPPRVDPPRRRICHLAGDARAEEAGRTAGEGERGEKRRWTRVGRTRRREGGDGERREAAMGGAREREESDRPG